MRVELPQKQKMGVSSTHEEIRGLKLLIQIGMG